MNSRRLSILYTSILYRSRILEFSNIFVTANSWHIVKYAKIYGLSIAANLNCRLLGTTSCTLVPTSGRKQLTVFIWRWRNYGQSAIWGHCLFAAVCCNANKSKIEFVQQGISVQRLWWALNKGGATTRGPMSGFDCVIKLHGVISSLKCRAVWCSSNVGFNLRKDACK